MSGMVDSKDVEKSGTGFQRVNDFCKQQNVTWNYRKEAYGFFFEFIRTNVQINTELGIFRITGKNGYIELIIFWIGTAIMMLTVQPLLFHIFLGDCYRKHEL